MNTSLPSTVTRVDGIKFSVEVTLPQREDVVNDGGHAERILANAREPVREGEGGYFTVPKVVE